METFIIVALLVGLLVILQRIKKGEPNLKRDKIITFVIIGILVLEIIVVAWPILKYL